jgi:hypothetical protein
VKVPTLAGGAAENATKRSLAHVRQRGGGGREVAKEDSAEPSGAEENSQRIRRTARSSTGTVVGFSPHSRVSVELHEPYWLPTMECVFDIA